MLSKRTSKIGIASAAESIRDAAFYRRDETTTEREGVNGVKGKSKVANIDSNCWFLKIKF